MAFSDHVPIASSSKTRTRPVPPPPSTPLVHLSFTHDASCFIAADASAVRWLCCDTFKLRGLYQEKDASMVVAAAGDMLQEKASVCAIVSRVPRSSGSTGGSEEDTFAIRRWNPGFLNYHWRYKECEAEVEAGTGEVRAVHVHGDLTVLVLDGSVDVYGAETNVGLLRRVETRGSNPLGLCAVSGFGGRAPFVFACPRVTVGEAHVERWAEEFDILSIPAHSSPLACMALSADGRLLATASIKGTVLRVFCAAGGTLLQELRRGVDRADIHCLAFSPDSKWLAASSNKGTIHVFRVNADVIESSSPEDDGDDLDAPAESTSSPGAKVKQSRSSLSYFITGLMPVPSYFHQDHSLAKFRLREGIKYMVAFGREPHIVLIVGMDGSFHRCQFDPVNGGDMEKLEYRNFMIGE